MRIGISGSSFGAVLATYLSEKRNIKSIFLRAPALYGENMMKVSMGEVLDNESRIFNDMDHVKDIEMMKIISKFQGNLIIVASEKDDLIPLSLSEAFYNEATQAKKKELRIIKNAPHAIKDPAQREELMQITIDWFKETL